MKKTVFRLAVLSILTLTAMSCRKEYNYNNTTIQYQTEQDTGGVISGDALVSKDGRRLIKWQNKDTQSLDMESHPILKDVKIIENDAFRDMNITSIILPSQLEQIESAAFYNTKLTSVVIPNSVVYVGNNAFGDNSLLTSVELSKGLKDIEAYTFQNSPIASIEIPEGVEKIHTMAFRDTKLETIILPSTLKEIESGAFYNQLYYNGEDHFIKTIIINATTPPTIGSAILSYAYITPPAEFEIRVPAESVEAYKTAQEWQDYADYIVAQ